jgi:hypothetical protein
VDFVRPIHSMAITISRYTFLPILTLMKYWYFNLNHFQEE